MASFFKKLAKATPALTQGITTGMKLRQDAQQLEDARIKRLADEYASGLSRTEDGRIGVNPEFNDPNSELYKYVQRNAELKRSATPVLSYGDISAIKAGTADAGLKIPANVAQSVLNPKPVATPDQIAAYEAEFGAGTGANLSPGQISNARARQFGLSSSEERARLAREEAARKHAETLGAADKRQDKAIGVAEAARRDAAARHREDKLQTQREKLGKEIKESAGEQMFRAMADLDATTKIFTDPDGAAYNKLPAKSGMLGSFLGDNMGGLAANLGGAGREMQLIQQITGPIIRKEAGLAQTVSEAARLKIQTGLNTGNPKLLAQGLRDARNDMAAYKDRMGKVYDPEVVAELMGPGTPMDYSGLLPKVKASPSDQRAAAAKKVAPGDRAASAKKFGMSQKTLDAIAAPDPKIAEYATKYGMDYDSAEKLLRERGYGQKAK